MVHILSWWPQNKHGVKTAWWKWEWLKARFLSAHFLVSFCYLVSNFLLYWHHFPLMRYENSGSANNIKIKRKCDKSLEFPINVVMALSFVALYLTKLIHHLFLYLQFIITGTLGVCSTKRKSPYLVSFYIFLMKRVNIARFELLTHC